MSGRRLVVLLGAVLVACAAVATAVAVTRGDSRPTSNDLGHLRVDIVHAPREVSPGQDVDYVVLVSNVSHTDVKLDPCPSYTSGIEFDQLDSDHAVNLGPVSAPRHLDCSKFSDGRVRAGTTTQLRMSLQVPTLPSFPCLDEQGAEGQRLCFDQSSDQPATLYWTLRARPALLRHYAHVEITLRAPG